LRSIILVEHDLFRKTGFHFSGSCSNRLLKNSSRLGGWHVIPWI
jgi:hypothetical protein